VSAARPALEVVAELRREVERMQGAPARQAVPTHPALEGLLSLETGGVYGVDAASLALLLMSGPSAAGTWSAVVGAPDLGVEAAVAMGVDPHRTVFVPDPQDRWLEVTAALVDVVGLVVVRPPSAVGEGDAARLGARLRKQGCVLVPWGVWPRCDARLTLATTRWAGVGAGDGHLRAREATVTVHRGTAPSRTRDLLLPADDLTVRPVRPQVAAPPATGVPAIVRSPAFVRSAG
jgi:hypothetical protein